MMINILITTQMMIKDEARWRLVFEKKGVSVDFVPSKQFLTEQECLALPAKYTGWIAGDDEITAAVLDRLAPTLRVISKWGAGIDSIDKEHADVIGVKVLNSPGAFATPVSELAVGYILGLTREIVATDQAVRAGEWPKNQCRALDELSVGILGFGAIGKAIGRRLKPFGCSITFSDPFVEESSGEFMKLEIEQLFRESNVIVVACPLTKRTRQLVDLSLLKLMPRPSYLVNISRGAIVNERDLIWALENQVLRAAALDVYEVEPLSPESDLRNNNVIFGSHNANNTYAIVEAVHNNTVDNLFVGLT